MNGFDNTNTSAVAVDSAAAAVNSAANPPAAMGPFQPLTSREAYMVGQWEQFRHELQRQLQAANAQVANLQMRCSNLAGAYDRAAADFRSHRCLWDKLLASHKAMELELAAVTSQYDTAEAELAKEREASQRARDDLAKRPAARTKESICKTCGEKDGHKGKLEWKHSGKTGLYTPFELYQIGYKEFEARFTRETALKEKAVTDLESAEQRINVLTAESEAQKQQLRACETTIKRKQAMNDERDKKIRALERGDKPMRRKRKSRDTDQDTPTDAAPPAKRQCSERSAGAESTEELSEEERQAERDMQAAIEDILGQEKDVEEDAEEDDSDDDNDYEEGADGDDNNAGPNEHRGVADVAPTNSGADVSQDDLVINGDPYESEEE